MIVLRKVGRGLALWASLVMTTPMTFTLRSHDHVYLTVIESVIDNLWTLGQTTLNPPSPLAILSSPFCTMPREFYSTVKLIGYNLMDCRNRQGKANISNGEPIATIHMMCIWTVLQKEYLRKSLGHNCTQAFVKQWKVSAHRHISEPKMRVFPGNPKSNYTEAFWFRKSI
jgi:hypothetical protein